MGGPEPSQTPGHEKECRRWSLFELPVPGAPLPDSESQRVNSLLRRCDVLSVAYRLFGSSISACQALLLVPFSPLGFLRFLPFSPLGFLRFLPFVSSSRPEVWRSSTKSHAENRGVLERLPRRADFFVSQAADLSLLVLRPASRDGLRAGVRRHLR